jgi:hypothetical protein
MMASTHQVRGLPCAAEEFDGYPLGNIWDYTFYLLLLCSPPQFLVGAMVFVASGTISIRMIALSHLVSALVQARPRSLVFVYGKMSDTKGVATSDVLRRVGHSPVGIDGSLLL